MASPEDILTFLQSCWCEALAETTLGSPGQCCISPARPVIAECCAGVAWVRMVDAYPSKSFPQVYSQPDNCRVDTWAINVEIGVSRCLPQPCGVVSNQCCTEDLKAAQGNLSDFNAMRRVFACCLSAIKDEFGQPVIRQDEIIVGRYQIQAEADCTYATLTATIRSAEFCDCG